MRPDNDKAVAHSLEPLSVVMERLDKDTEREMLASPDLRNRMMEDRLAAKKAAREHELNGVWRSCCFQADVKAIQYFTQVLIITCVMSLCVYQLITNASCEAQTGYMGLLTLLLGLLVPAPRIKQ